MQILLVEDNLRLAEAIGGTIARAGFGICAVHTGGDALAELKKQPFDLLILDLGLPDMDGIAVLQKIRAARMCIPVLILTARDSITDKIHGLSQGADDYMVKPFETEALLQRIRALLPHETSPGKDVIALNDLSFDTANRQAKVRDIPILLSRQEAEVLELLMCAKGKMVPKRTLECRLENSQARSVDALVSVLRDKLHSHDSKIEIHTLKGIGYMLETALEEVFQ